MAKKRVRIYFNQGNEIILNAKNFRFGKKEVQDFKGLPLYASANVIVVPKSPPPTSPQ